MERSADFGALQGRLERFRDERDWAQFHSPANLAKAIVVEAAELLELFLWTSAEGEPMLSSERLAEVEAELADVVIQCLNLASAAGIDVVDAVNRKIDVNEERYPVEKARGSSAKYTEL